MKRARMVGLSRLSLETETPKAEAFRDTRGPGADGWRKILARSEKEATNGKARTARNLALVRLLHDRALRRGEAVGIDFPEDLDLSRPAVAVVGKGKHARQWLTINPETRDAITRYLALRGAWAGPLFVRAARPGPAPAGAPELADSGSSAAPFEPNRLDGESVNRMVKALAKRAGLTRAVRAHSLRHASITEALDSGYDVRYVKMFSRHSKIDTVLIYDDRRTDVGGEISRALGRRRNPRRPKKGEQSAGKGPFPDANNGA